MHISTTIHIRTTTSNGRNILTPKKYIIGVCSWQGWGRREGILCMVASGQLRVGTGLHQAFWFGLCGLQERTHSPPKVFRLLVHAVPRGRGRLKRWPERFRGNFHSLRTRRQEPLLWSIVWRTKLLNVHGMHISPQCGLSCTHISCVSLLR